MRLASDLRRSLEQLCGLPQEERRRIRDDLHDGPGRSPPESGRSVHGWRGRQADPTRPDPWTETGQGRALGTRNLSRFGAPVDGLLPPAP